MPINPIENLEPVSSVTTKLNEVIDFVNDGGGAIWGSITGTLSNQTDLNTALGLKANADSLATVASSGLYADLTGIPSTFDPTAHNQAFSTITSTPTTLSGYGITDAFNGAYSSLSGIPSTFAPSAHNQAFSTITSTPTTLAGYGITDAVTSGSLGALASLNQITNTQVATGAAIGWAKISKSGAVPGDVGAQPLDSDLTAIAALTTTAFGRSLLTPVDAASARTLLEITSSFDGAYSSLTGIPSTFAPSAHNQAFSTITSTPTTLAGYGITDAQPLDSDLTAIAALTTTTFGRSLLTQADGAATRSTIGAGTSNFDGAYASLSGIPSTFTPSAHTQAFSTITSTPTTLSGYGITDAQPLDSDLTAIAALTTTAFGRSLLELANVGALKTSLSLVKGDVGLGNVDNTSDTSKPISTATQTALDAKVGLTADTNTLAYAATVDLDMSALTGKIRTITLTGNLTFTTSNRAAGRNVAIRLVADTSTRTLTFPAGWKFLGAVAPSGVLANKDAILSLTFFGTADSDCYVSYAAVP